MSELVAAAAAGHAQGPHARALAAVAAQRAAAACARARCGACEACCSTQGSQRRCLANRAAAAAAGGHSGAQACYSLALIDGMLHEHIPARWS